MNITLTVNGQTLTRDVAPYLLLADFLRDELRLTGTHVGCDTTQCGCCIIHLNEKAVKSCTMLAVQPLKGWRAPMARFILCKRLFGTIMDCNAGFVRRAW